MDIYAVKASAPKPPLKSAAVKSLARTTDAGRWTNFVVEEDNVTVRISSLRKLRLPPHRAWPRVARRDLLLTLIAHLHSTESPQP